MTYVAMLRGRRVLTRFSIFLACALVLALAVIFSQGGHHVRIETSRPSTHMIPLTAIVGGTAMAMYFVVTCLGANLDAEYRTAAIAWTRPLSRYALASRFFAVDAGSAAVAWILGLVVSAIVFAVLGTFKDIVVGYDFVPSLVALMAVAVMWYGMIVLVASLFPGRGNTVVWAAWAYALFVPGLYAIPLPPLGHAVTVALNYIDPLTYISHLGADSGHRNPILPADDLTHALIAFSIGIVALAIGTRLWATREVTA